MRENEKLCQLALEGGTYETRLTRKFALRKPYAKKDAQVIKALIPGVIERIDTTVGAKVRHGDILIIQDAMKMHNRIRAPHDGTIKAIAVAAGEKVGKGQVLLEMA